MVFRFQNTKVHLTYKTHVSVETFKRILNKLPPTKMWSLVHEIGDENEEVPTPYEHTHVFVWTTKKMDTTDPRYFDVMDEDDTPIHPHMQNKRSLDWAKIIIMKYHHGHKTKADGKKYFIAPILLHQVGVEEWKMEEDQFKLALEAPSLEEACLELGIGIKGMGDVRLARAEMKKRKLNPPKYPLESFNRAALDLSLPVLLAGNSDCGKTQFAKAHFVNPLVCRHNEGAKHFDPNFHDGIVFDDMDFQDWPLTSVQHLLDTDEPSTMRCLNGSYEIPANTKKIFTSNSDMIFRCKKFDELNESQQKSITRRYRLVPIDACLYARP